jgi:hypothetical protein
MVYINTWRLVTRLLVLPPFKRLKDFLSIFSSRNSETPFVADPDGALFFMKALLPERDVPGEFPDTGEHGFPMAREGLIENAVEIEQVRPTTFSE